MRASIQPNDLPERAKWMLVGFPIFPWHLQFDLSPHSQPAAASEFAPQRQMYPVHQGGRIPRTVQPEPCLSQSLGLLAGTDLCDLGAFVIRHKLHRRDSSPRFRFEAQILVTKECFLQSQ